jgi:hypothetical protein
MEAPIVPGTEKPPAICPYCGSSAIVPVEVTQEGLAIKGEMYKTKNGSPSLCLLCHRIWTVLFVQWEP